MDSRIRRRALLQFNFEEFFIVERVGGSQFENKKPEESISTIFYFAPSDSGGANNIKNEPDAADLLFAIPIQPLSSDGGEHFTYVRLSQNSKWIFGYSLLLTKKNSQKSFVFLSYVPYAENGFYRALSATSSLFSSCENYRPKLQSFLHELSVKDLSFGGVWNNLESRKKENYGSGEENLNVPFYSVAQIVFPKVYGSYIPTAIDTRCISEFYNSFSTKSIILILASLLAERRILIISKKLSRSSSIALASSLLLYPLQWQHLFIPLLPSSMQELIQAPFPFILGTSYANLGGGKLRGEERSYRKLTCEEESYGKLTCEEESYGKLTDEEESYGKLAGEEELRCGGELVEESDGNHAQEGSINVQPFKERLSEKKASYSYLTRDYSNGPIAYDEKGAAKLLEEIGNEKDIVIVDADNDVVKNPFSNDYDKLPHDIKSYLKKRLEQKSELAKTCLKVFVKLLGKYESGIIEEHTSGDFVFSEKRFLSAVKSSRRPYLKDSLLRTQLFLQFIDEKLRQLNTGKVVPLDIFNSEIEKKKVGKGEISSLKPLQNKFMFPRPSSFTSLPSSESSEKEESFDDGDRIILEKNQSAELTNPPDEELIRKYGLEKFFVNYSSDSSTRL